MKSTVIHMDSAPMQMRNLKNCRQTETGTIGTPAGYLYYEINEGFLTGLEFTDRQNLKDSESNHILDIRCSYPENINTADLLRSQIDQYFNKKRKVFSVPVRIDGTPFQRKVWETLLSVPYGSVISYKELSLRTGRPDAVRAVASANSKNPILILLPCHRIIASDGSPGGYSGGTGRKIHLLRLEGSLP